MVVVVPGGIITSTLLTLVRVPCAHTYQDDLQTLLLRRRRRARVAESELVIQPPPTVAGAEEEGAGVSGADLNRPVVPVRRSRVRVGGRRRQAYSRGQYPPRSAPGGSSRPPGTSNAGLRWRRGRPACQGVGCPFWLLILNPWLAWGLLLLTHLGACLICMPR